MSDVCVVGLGYMGLPLAAMLATHGSEVLGVDIDDSVVRSVNDGRASLEEPGLTELVARAVSSGNLVARTVPEPAQAFMIAVPTPVMAGNQPDMSFVISAVVSISSHLKRGDLVVVESTISPGATLGEIATALQGGSGLQPGVDFMLAYCPERAIPGSTVREIAQNDRIVGGIDSASTKSAARLYASFVTGRIIETDARSAELAKLAENTFRDVNVALANEILEISERCGANGWEVIEMANRHPRVRLHAPGPGVGGHCLPVDPYFLVAAAPGSAKLISTARQVNDSRPEHIVYRMVELLGSTENPVAAVLGASYKADVSDTRETPALPIIEGLERAGVKVRVSDPHAAGFVRDLVSLEEAFSGADVAVVVTDHASYGDLDPSVLGKLMRNRVIVDTRNSLPRSSWVDAGFEYVLIGDGRAAR